MFTSKRITSPSLNSANNQLQLTGVAIGRRTVENTRDSSSGKHSDIDDETLMSSAFRLSFRELLERVTGRLC